MSSHSAWSEEKYQETLDALRRDYPGYTDNELYAIWCHENGLIPVNEDGKVQVEQWRMHAEEDGRHVREGGFGVSRAIFGRARQARKGVPKPPRQKAAKGADEAEPQTPKRTSAEISGKALAFAREYDRVAGHLDEITRLQGEVDRLLTKLHGCHRSILEELLADRQELRPLLDEAGLL